MANSIRERIVQRVVTVLDAALAADTVWRSRQQGFKRGPDIHTVVEIVDESVEYQMDDRAERTLRMRLRSLAYGSAPDARLDERAQEIVKTLADDFRLDGLVVNCSESGSVWQFDDVDGEACTLDQIYTIRYRTRIDDPSAQW